MRFDVAHGLKLQSELDELIDFFRARQGRRRGFLFKDWIDYQHNAGAQANISILGVGADGVNFQTFQLIKNYTDVRTYVRNIAKPINSTIELDTNGQFVAQMGNADERLTAMSTDGMATPDEDGDFTVGPTGILTWRDNAAATALTGTSTPGDPTVYSFTPARPGNTGQSVYITGETGSSAFLVNNKRWKIIDTVANAIHLDVDTSGGTLTGTPQFDIEPQTIETEVRARDFEFDVPVRFDIDEMEAQLEFYETHNWRGIQLLEVRV